jgi:hypothetical protein
LSDPLYSISLTSTHCTTLINPTTVTCFNCEKDNYFTSFCLELKDIDNIKKIKEEEKEISNKLKKKDFRERLPPKVPYWSQGD